MRGLAAALALLSLSCASNAVPVGAPEPVAYDPSDRVDYSVTECGAQVLLLIPFFSNGRLERAMDLIRERAGDRYLADVRIRERWTFLVFGTIYCTDVVAATYGRR